MPKIIKKVTPKQFMGALFPMVVLYFVALFFTYGYPAFEIFWWMSPVVHTFGGIVTATTLVSLYRLYKKQLKWSIQPAVFLAICLVSSVVTIGVAWEIYEQVVDSIFASKFQLGVVDALTDLTMDTAGAIIYCVAWYQVLQSLAKPVAVASGRLRRRSLDRKKRL